MGNLYYMMSGFTSGKKRLGGEARGVESFIVLESRLSMFQFPLG